MHPVTAHFVPDASHVRPHEFPEQPTSHDAAPAHLTPQLPPGHEILHDAPVSQVMPQPPLGQSKLHVAPAWHSSEQPRPSPPHVCEHVPPLHTQAFPAVHVPPLLLVPGPLESLPVPHERTIAATKKDTRVFLIRASITRGENHETRRLMITNVATRPTR